MRRVQREGLFTMKRTFSRILPLYGVLPALGVPLSTVLVYWGTRLFNVDRVHYDISLPFPDGGIPFWRWAIIIYIFSYVFWLIGFLKIARDERQLCYEMFSGELLAKLLTLTIFLIFPTVMASRPDVFPVENPFDWLTRMIYDLDPPDNLFPSMHCMESWIVLRGAFRCRNLRHPTVWRVFCLGMTLAIFASTLLVKQHVFLDVLGGVAVAEAGLLLTRVLRAGRVYPALERLLKHVFRRS